MSTDQLAIEDMMMQMRQSRNHDVSKSRSGERQNSTEEGLMKQVVWEQEISCEMAMKNKFKKLRQLHERLAREPFVENAFGAEALPF